MSLYTHVARYCAPCPAHHRPRLHRYLRPPDPRPAPFTMPDVKVRRTVEPMSFERREAAYVRQNRGRPLTARQWRQLIRMAGRAGLEVVDRDHR